MRPVKSDGLVMRRTFLPYRFSISFSDATARHGVLRMDVFHAFPMNALPLYHLCSIYWNNSPKKQYTYHVGSPYPLWLRSTFPARP